MKMPARISQPKTDYYPVKGGLDLVTPAISVSPGKCFDAQNYMPDITGGYRRLYGYERFDGGPAPSGATYWLVKVALTGALAPGATFTGATSAATGRVLGVFGDQLVFGRLTGVLVLGEVLNVAGAAQATVAGPVSIRGASLPSDHADYTLLAANDIRADILPVPGSGPIRGIVIFNDITYAFRDSIDGTYGGIYKATPTGWQTVGFGTQIQFTAATQQIFAGDLVTGATSGATALVTKAILRVNTWTTGGSGTLIVSGASGTFVKGESLKVGTVVSATADSAVTNIKRLPGGVVEMVEGTFNGKTGAHKIYGADGVNLAFEFDGVTYTPILTGTAIDTPKHVAVHQDFLWLSFGSSLQFSGIGNPFSYDAITGAGELAVGDDVAGLKPYAGSKAGGSMAAFTDNKTEVVYGSSAADFNIVVNNIDIGYYDNTIQTIGNDMFGLTARGIQAFSRTQAYGDFLYSAISYEIHPLIEKLRGKQTCSVTSQSLNQYRIFFNDGTGIFVGLEGGKVHGLMPVNYGRVVRCATAKTVSTGAEVMFFGSDDGYVYQDNLGTSFDGAPIEAWIRLSFNNIKSPGLIKRYLRAIFDVKADGYANARVAYDLGYANPDVRPGSFQPLTLLGNGGYWDAITWGDFVWESPVIAQASISMDGSETNVAFLFYSQRAQDRSHVVQGVNLHYLPRHLKRN